MSPETEINTHSVVEMSEPDLQRAGDKLLALWVDDFEKKCVLPIHNKPAFLATLLEAKKSTQPVILLAIACLDWQPASDGQDPNIDRVITPVFTDNKRAERVVEGFSQLQRALNSFGINCSVSFTFSDVEAIMTEKLANMGQRLFNVDLERDIEISIKSIFQHASMRGVNFSTFRHLDTLQDAKNESDLRRLQKVLAGKDDTSFHELLSGLYRFDLGELPKIIARENPVIWLNLISRDFLDHIEEIEELSEDINPSLAIATPFANAGSWSTAPVHQEVFLSKKEYVSKMLNVDPTLEDTLWLRSLLGIPDKDINNLLDLLEIKFATSSSATKFTAVNLVGELILEKKLDNEINTHISDEISFARFLRAHLNLNAAKITDVIRNGGAKINGHILKDPGFMLPVNTKFIVKVGNKVTIIVN